MIRRVASAFAIIVFVAVTSVTAFGQVTSSLSGTVTDPTGAVMAGATVTVKNAASGSEFKTVTSNQGTYNVPSLGAGKYVVAVTASGFKNATVQDIEIDAGTPATVNVTLEVGQATETVVVQGGARDRADADREHLDDAEHQPDHQSAARLAQSGQFRLDDGGREYAARRSQLDHQRLARERDRHHAGRHQRAGQFQQDR